MALDISGLSYFMPIFGFLFVFTIVYALLAKTKILGDSMFVNLLISFIVAIIFSVMSSAQTYVQVVTPWFAILVIVLFFILIIAGLSPHKLADIIGEKFVWIFIAALIAVFVVSAIFVFPNLWGQVQNFVTTQAKVAGAIILLIIAALAAWVITRK